MTRRRSSRTLATLVAPLVAVLTAAGLGLGGCIVDPNDGPGASQAQQGPGGDGGPPQLVDPADRSSLPYQGVQVGPDAPDFYTAPQPPAGAKPGDVIWARPVPAPRGSRGFALLYWSTAEDGSTVPVSGVLLEPESARPGTARQVVAGGHGAAGLGDQCAPSVGYFTGNAWVTPFVQSVLAKGHVYVESDYQGLGTPGEHPFVNARSAGRNLLDAIRAVGRMTGAGTEVDAVVIGQSQGGGAALLAAEQQPEYAPELRLLGAVGIAPPSRMDQLDDQLSGGPFAGYLLASLHGLLAAYPALDADASGLNDTGRAALADIRNRCIDQVLSRYRGRTEAEFGLDRVFDAPDFADALASNDPGLRPLRVPTLVVHGEQDDTIPVQNSRDLVQRYCAAGAQVAARFVPGAGHVDVSTAAQPDIESYVADRLAGKPAPTTCT